MINPVIERLYKSGELKQLVQGGWVPATTLTYYELSVKVLFYINRGMKKNPAVCRVAIITGFSTETIYRALKKMESDHIDSVSTEIKSKVQA